MGDVGVRISHEHFHCSLDRQVKMSEVCLCEDPAHCRKQTPLKQFLPVCIPYNLKEKTSAVLPCSLQTKYSDSAIPCFGQECGCKTSPGILPPAGCAKTCF